MAVLTHWIESNWFAVIQAAGILIQSIAIICGLRFTALALRLDSKTRRAEVLLKMNEQYRELWSEIRRRQDLRRITMRKVDLVANPITSEEEESLNGIFVHVYTAWRAAEHDPLSLLSLDVIAVDMGRFLSLPIPHDVWFSTKEGRDPRFIRFMEESYEKSRTARLSNQTPLKSSK